MNYSFSNVFYYNISRGKMHLFFKKKNLFFICYRISEATNTILMEGVGKINSYFRKIGEYVDILPSNSKNGCKIVCILHPFLFTDRVTLFLAVFSSVFPV